MALSDHDWQRPNPSHATTWVCTQCQCTRISADRPPAHLLVAPEVPGRRRRKGRGVRGPGPGERGMTCGEIQAAQVHDL